MKHNIVWQYLHGSALFNISNILKFSEFLLALDTFQMHEPHIQRARTQIYEKKAPKRTVFKNTYPRNQVGA